MPRRSGRRACLGAQEIVAIWNARQAGGRALWLSHGSERPIAAGLVVEVSTAREAGVVSRSVHLRTLDRPPGASISSLIPSLSCRRCSPHAPFAKLEALTTERARFV